MSDDLGKSLEWSCRDPVTHEPIDDGDYSNATVSEVKQAIAEITRLRAALAAARREGMEEAAKRLEELHKNHNCDPESGTLTRKLGRYDRWPEAAKTAILEHDAGYYRAIADGVAHIRAAAGEDRQP